MFLILEVQRKGKASNITFCLCTRQVTKKNVAGPTKIDDRCQANTDVCQESFNYALCINEKCQCITGYHFVNKTKACVQSQGIHSYFFFPQSRRKIIIDRDCFLGARRKTSKLNKKIARKWKERIDVIRVSRKLY